MQMLTDRPYANREAYDWNWFETYYNAEARTSPFALDNYWHLSVVQRLVELDVLQAQHARENNIALAAALALCSAVYERALVLWLSNPLNRASIGKYR